MIVILFNREEITVSKQEADNIDKMIASDVKWIKIGDYRIRPNAIMMIKPGGYTEGDLVDPTHRIDPPDHRGRHSPAKERIRDTLKRKYENKD